MTKAKISEYDAVAANNTDVNGVNISEGCPPSSMNNMGREIMAALKRFQTGADGDSVTVGGSLVVSNTLTAGPVSATTLNTSGAVVFNDAGADVDFRVEGDTEPNLLFVDASTDRVGIGKANPEAMLNVSGSTSPNFWLESTDTNKSILQCIAGNSAVELRSTYNTGGSSFVPMTFYTSGSERLRIDASGNLLVGTTTNANSARFNLASASGQRTADFRTGTTSGSATIIGFLDGSNQFCGQIYVDATANTTVYATSSDYRLKQNVQPISGALEKISNLNPVTWNWKHAPEVTGEGFIAHELQAVCPDAVTGEKDETEIQQVEVSPAVPATYDEEGNELTPAVEAVYEEREVPKYQGVDTSFLVATLTAAIQELSAKNDALEARIAALENA